MYTVNQISIKLMTEMGWSMNDTFYIDIVEGWLNETYNHITWETKWTFKLGSPESVSLTVAAGAEYSLSTSVAEVTSGRLTATFEELEFVDVEVLIASDVDLTLAGKPQVFYLSGYDSTTGKNKIKVWPVPDATYAAQFINYTRPEVLASNATIPLPEELIPVLKMGVRSYMLEDDGFVDRADVAFNKFGLMLEKRKQRYALIPADHQPLAVSDLPSKRTPRVRMDPTHYSNY